jgi:hypothetical protein
MNELPVFNSYQGHADTVEAAVFPIQEMSKNGRIIVVWRFHSILLLLKDH